MGGPRDSNVGLPIAKAGFKSSIVRGLMATILAPMGPKEIFKKKEQKQNLNFNKIIYSKQNRKSKFKL